MRLRVQLGLPESQRAAAARLYWQAFGGKLGRVMGPDARALAFLHRVIRADHAIVALGPEGQLIGLAGFKTAKGGFAAGDMSDMRAIYGLFGAAWRCVLLWLLQSDTDNDRFLMDGLCVLRDHRSEGTGTALLTAVCAEAARRGYTAVRLDVIDTNWRARALYTRQGFTVLKTEKLGLLRHVFGFAASITMVRQLD